MSQILSSRGLSSSWPLKSGLGKGGAGGIEAQLAAGGASWSRGPKRGKSPKLLITTAPARGATELQALESENGPSTASFPGPRLRAFAVFALSWDLVVLRHKFTRAHASAP